MRLETFAMTHAAMVPIFRRLFKLTQTIYMTTNPRQRFLCLAYAERYWHSHQATLVDASGCESYREQKAWKINVERIEGSF